MPLAKKREEILSLLRGMAQRPLADEDALWREIEIAIESAASGPFDGNSKNAIDDCVYALALVYAHHVGAMPAFSNGDRPTRFERFALAVPMPREFRITPNRVKASIRRLDAKHNPAFARDLQSMAVRKPVEIGSRERPAGPPPLEVLDSSQI